MKNVTTLKRASVGLLAALCAYSAQATEFIQNGDFEQGPGTQRRYDFFDGWPSDQVSHWVIDNHGTNNVYYFDSAAATSRAAFFQPLATSFDDVANVPGDTLRPGAVQHDPNGGYFIAIDGANFSTGDSWIYQTVSGLTPGQSYQLTFHWGAAQLVDYYGPTIQGLTVWLGDSPVTGVSQSTTPVDEDTHYFSGWMDATMNFVAQGSTQVLTFQGIGTPAGSPPMLLLDGVSLTESPVPAVPEPTTWATLLVGCVAIGARSRRRRQGATATCKQRRLLR